MTDQVDAMAVIERLAGKIAQQAVEIATLQARLAAKEATDDDTSR